MEPTLNNRTRTWGPGFYVLDKLTLFSVSGSGTTTNVFDIIGLQALVAAEIRQGIYNGSMEATFVINDAYNLNEDFNDGRGLQGEEFIDVSIQQPEVPTGIDLQFMVESIETRVATTNQTALLTLHCITKEFLVDAVNNVNQAFNGTTSSIAQNIYNNRIINDKLWGKVLANQAFARRSFEADSSVGREKDLIVTGKGPFDAIHMMGRRSDGGPVDECSLYVFFESTTGYQFRNVQKLIRENPLKNSSDENRTYTYRATDAHGDPMTGSQRTTIKSMSASSSPSALMRLASGVFKSHTKMVDVFGKNFENIDYQHDSPALGTSNFNSAVYSDSISNFFDREFLVLNDKTKPNEGFEKLQPKRDSFMDFLATHSYMISIAGDCSLQAGEVISIDLPPPSHIIEEVGESSKYSGKYLVQKVTHIFDTDKFVTNALVSKDALNSSEFSFSIADFGSFGLF